MVECNIFTVDLEEKEFTLMQSVDKSKVLHRSLGHHLGAEACIETGVMQQQEVCEIQQGQIHNALRGIERCTQLYRLRLTWGEALLHRIWGLHRQLSVSWMHSSALLGSWCQRGCILGQLAEQSFSGKGAVGRHSQTSHSLTLGSCFLSRISFSWSQTDLSRSVPVPAMAPWTSPDGQNSKALTVFPAWPRTCHVVMGLSGHHQAVLEAGHHLQACPTHPTHVVWDRHWLQRPCPASLGTELKFQLPIPQGTTSPRCVLTQTAEYDPLCVLAARKISTLLDCINKQHTHQGRDCASYPKTFNSSEKLCTVWNPGVHNWSVNWSEFSGVRPGRHWDGVLRAPWEEAKGWDFQSGAAVVSGIETFHSSDIFKTKLSGLARMTILWAGGWTNTSSSLF